MSEGSQVDIWEERRVFGSRAQGLREELLGKRPLLSANESKHFTLPSYQVTYDPHLCSTQSLQLMSTTGSRVLPPRGRLRKSSIILRSLDSMFGL